MPLKRLFCAALLAAPLGWATAADKQADAGDKAPDVRAGAVMFRQCALCHGQHGQGILGGKYPRIAGMPEYYLLNALNDYRSGERGYDAMLVVGSLRTADDDDLKNLAAYVSDLDVAIDVPAPADGDAKSGKKLYQSDCKTCHGRTGEGKSRKESPPLRSQYPEYLLRQIALFKTDAREHAGDPDDETFVDYSDEDLIDILAFISTFDDSAAAEAGADKEDAKDGEGKGNDDDKN